MVQFMMNLMRVNDSDLNECIPEMLGNALLVMKESGIFEQGDERKQMWLNSVQVIEPLAPSFKSLLHQPPPPPTPPQNSPSQSKNKIDNEDEKNGGPEKMKQNSPLKMNSNLSSSPSSPLHLQEQENKNDENDIEKQKLEKESGK